MMNKDELNKDIATSIPLVGELVNTWVPFLPQHQAWIGVAAGILLRVLFNIFGGQTPAIPPAKAGMILLFLLTGMLLFGSMSCAMFQKPLPASCEQCVSDYLKEIGLVKQETVQKNYRPIATPTPLPTAAE
jgi:hypothetical protein